METKASMPQLSFKELQRSARNGDWQNIDAALPYIRNDIRFTRWALGTGMGDKDPNVRNYAVSIVEKTDHPLVRNQFLRLIKLMKCDENPFVQFRACFALIAHNYISIDVVSKLDEAARNEDVRETAESYKNGLQEARVFSLEA